MKFGIGQAVNRVEDQRLLTGAGRYTDDIQPDGAAHALFVRSPYAHARITGIDSAAALAVPGVLAVYTAADLARAGLAPLMTASTLTNRDGSPMVKVPRPILCGDLVRHVGDAVAFIVAETLDAARDGADALAVDYDPLPAVVDPAAALAADAPVIWDSVPGNLAFDWEQGDAAGTRAAFAAAAHVIDLTLVNNRLISNPLEPRMAIGVALGGGSGGGRLQLTASTQGVHAIKRAMAKEIFGRPADQFQIITPDVGGAFGTKIFPYPEQPLVLLAAEKLGRPVKWTGERADSFLSDAHGRDNLTTARLALDEQGRFLALAVETIANLGAYQSYYAPFVATAAGTGMLPGVYDIPVAHVRVRGAYTNTVPVDAYRGAGRPEASYVIERLVGAAARRLGVPATELRRRNFIRPAQFPYRTAFGKTYDSGDFARLMDLARTVSDEAGFPARRAAAAGRGRLLGRGLAYYVEACGGGGDEGASVEVLADGRVQVLIGTQSNGQGHATAYAQIVAGRLGVDIAAIEVIQGDSDKVLTGKGTGGSRSLPVGGAALDKATLVLIDKAKFLAAHMLECAAEDFELIDGRLVIAGTDRGISFADIARRAAHGDVPEDFEGTRLYVFDKWQPPEATYPNGCHVCEIAIDPDTGTSDVTGYWVVDDFGAVINPKLLEGQVHGGIAQGIGQALLESCRYDPESGQLLSGSFMDYAMPRAIHLPAIDFRTENIPCTTNPLGIKGAGEAGAIGAPPAVIDAVLDALTPLGVTQIDMPATPEAVWRAIQSARV